jgi:hypothetical protein
MNPGLGDNGVCTASPWWEIAQSLLFSFFSVPGVLIFVLTSP